MNALLSDRIWFDTRQAADYTGWSQKTVVRALRSGELKGEQRGKGRHWRMRKDWLDAWNEGESA